MSSMNDDYYDLLGVEPDAEVGDIRAAYREKKAVVAERDDDGAKADAAALNKAWNVLSDPYQRGRYDQQLAETDGYDDEDADEDDDTIDVPATRTRTTRTSQSKPSQSNRQKGQRPPLVPTVKLPTGVSFPATRARVVAMVIDLLVLVLLFVVSAYVTDALEVSQQPHAHHQVMSVLPDQIKAAHDATNAAKKKATSDVKCDLTTDPPKASPATTDNQAYCEAKAHEKSLNDAYTEQTKKLTPIRTLVSGIYFLVALLVLLIPSLFGGQTLGKRLQGIRVVRMDGSPAGFVELFRRYGLMALAAFVLSLLLQGPIGALVVVFVATMWTRNPNRQGLQDRFAKTLVVTGTAD
jgi:uncharacterized RDD family membrane protein YckC